MAALTTRSLFVGLARRAAAQLQAGPSGGTCTPGACGPRSFSAIPFDRGADTSPPAACGSKVPWAEAVRLADAAGLARARGSCFHEAGHVVQLILGGYGVASTGLRWSVEGGRFALAGGWTIPGDIGRPLSATVAAAGFAAWVEAGGDPVGGLYGAGGDRDDDRGDYAAIRAALLREGRALDEGKAVRQARASLRRQWNAVLAVQEALMSQGYLGGREAERLVVAELGFEPPGLAVS